MLPGHLLAVAWPQGPEGRRHLIALVTPDDPKAEDTPQGARSLYRIDPDRAGAPRKLLDGLPEEIDALAALDLDGDGREEILLGQPGKIYSAGSPDAATAPRLLLEADGLTLRWAGSPPVFQATEVGRLRTWTLTGGQMMPGPALDLPVHAAREAQALRLSSLPATPIALPGGGAPLQVVGPEDSGKLRLRTLLFDATGKRSDAWALLPGKEKVDSFRYLALDGKPALLVTTSDAETIGVFAKQRLRLFSVAALALQLGVERPQPVGRAARGRLCNGEPAVVPGRAGPPRSRSRRPGRPRRPPTGRIGGR